MRHNTTLASLCLLLSGASCAQQELNSPTPGPIDHGIVMRLRDLTTSYAAVPREGDEEPLMFTFQTVYPNMELDEFERTQLAAWEQSIRVVTWPERELVPGHWEVQTEPWRIGFVQDAAFTERWYAMQINLATLPARLGIWHDEAPELGIGDHALVDGWVTSRFHVGPAALVFVSGVWDASSGSVGIGSTEPVFSRSHLRAGDVLSVTAGGRPLSCEPTVTDFPAGTAIQGGWSCFGEFVRSENIEVTLLADDLMTADGRRARVCAEGTPPRWVSVSGDPEVQARIRVRTCPDSAFLPDTAEGL